MFSCEKWIFKNFLPPFNELLNYLSVSIRKILLYIRVVIDSSVCVCVCVYGGGEGRKKWQGGSDGCVQGAYRGWLAEIGGKSTGTDCINSFQSVSITKLQHVKRPTLGHSGRSSATKVHSGDQILLQ